MRISSNTSITDLFVPDVVSWRMSHAQRHGIPRALAARGAGPGRRPARPVHAARAHRRRHLRGGLLREGQEVGQTSRYQGWSRYYNFKNNNNIEFICLSWVASLDLLQNKLNFFQSSHFIKLEVVIHPCKLLPLTPVTPALSIIYHLCRRIDLLF